MLPDLKVLQTVRWKQPHDQADFVSFVGDLASSAEELAAVMEPGGVYGDTMCQVPLDDGMEVFRVSPKRAHDVAEVYDGDHPEKCLGFLSCQRMSRVRQRQVGPRSDQRRGPSVCLVQGFSFTPLGWRMCRSSVSGSRGKWRFLRRFRGSRTRSIRRPVRRHQCRLAQHRSRSAHR